MYFFVFDYSYVFDIICKYYLVISFCLYLSYTLTAFLSMNRNGQNMDKMIQYQQIFLYYNPTNKGELHHVYKYRIPESFLS